MKILLISTCKEKLHEREFVEPHRKYLESKGIEVLTTYYKTDKIDADRVVICGTGIADNDYLKYLEFFEWIKNSDKPILGICSGSQIIASMFGSKISKNEEIGMTENEGNLFGREKFSAYNLHQNGFDGGNIEVLTKSNKSIQSFKIKNKKIYGVAFHPEVRNMWVMDEFLLL